MGIRCFSCKDGRRAGRMPRNIKRRLLSSVCLLTLLMSGAVRARAGALVTELWPCGIIPYEFDSSMTDPDKQFFRNTAARWEAVAAVKFVERTTEMTYLRVINQPNAPRDTARSE